MREPGYGWVSFTTDYGLQDGFVAACHGVIAGIAPEVRVLDVTHLVAPQAIRAGAEVLAQTVPVLPEAVHLVVVDPGVGTSRRGVIVETGRGVLVGPDNGVLVPAAAELGGVRGAYELTRPQWWREDVSRTFHGRDIFAPVAAWLARGMRPEELGAAMDISELVALSKPLSTVDSKGLRAEVVVVDHFGNVQLAVEGETLPRSWNYGAKLRVSAGDFDGTARLCRTFADVGEQELLIFTDSAGRVSIAVNGGSAAARLATGNGAIVRVTKVD